MKRSVEDLMLDIPGKVASVLNGFVKSGKTEKKIDTRARIVLMCAEPLTNEEIAKRLGVSRNTVSTWRKRFILPGRPRESRRVGGTRCPSGRDRTHTAS